MKTLPIWMELDDWVAKGGDICTNSLSLVMMQNQNQIQNQYSSSSSGFRMSMDERREGRAGAGVHSARLRRDRGRGQGAVGGGETGRYERRIFNNKSERPQQNKAVEVDEEEKDEDIVNEEEEEEIEGDRRDTDSTIISDERQTKRNQKKFRKISRTFGLSESVLSLLCVGICEGDTEPPVVSTSKKENINKRARTVARNADGICLRTFVLPFSLSDVVQGCLLVGGREKDAYAATTGE